MWPGFQRKVSIGDISAVNKKLDLVLGILKLLTKTETGMAIDTSKLLAEVTQQTTDNASLRALVVAQSAAMAQLSAQLAAAIASGDPVALAQVQTDIDLAVSSLSVDDAATQAALAANVAPTSGAAPVTDPKAG